MKTISLAKIQEELDYNPRTGRFTWKVAKPRARAGAIAGSLMPTGYLLLCVGGIRIMAHRLAWFWVHGEMPAAIDHLNGMRSDNRIVNLRPATSQVNAQNLRKSHFTNRSGILGVSWAPHAGKWKAQIQVKGVKHNLGYFDDKLDAGDAYLRAKYELHGGNTLTTPQNVDTLTCAVLKMCMFGT